MVAGLVAQGECKSGQPDLAMAHKATKKANAFLGAVEKRLRVGKLDAKIHVVGQFGKVRLKSLEKRFSPALWPRGIDWPKKTGADGWIEECHVWRCWQRMLTAAISPP